MQNHRINKSIPYGTVYLQNHRINEIWNGFLQNRRINKIWNGFLQNRRINKSILQNHRINKICKTDGDATLLDVDSFTKELVAKLKDSTELKKVFEDILNQLIMTHDSVEYEEPDFKNKGN